MLVLSAAKEITSEQEVAWSEYLSTEQGIQKTHVLIPHVLLVLCDISPGLNSLRNGETPSLSGSGKCLSIKYYV